MDYMPAWNIILIVEATKHAEEVVTINHGEGLEGPNNPSAQVPIDAFLDLLVR